jgi:hypothetical protein
VSSVDSSLYPPFCILNSTFCISPSPPFRAFRAFRGQFSLPPFCILTSTFCTSPVVDDPPVRMTRQYDIIDGHRLEVGPAWGMLTPEERAL